jgi:KDO2-lipid IV(A) lauroyltransferase
MFSFYLAYPFLYLIGVMSFSTMYLVSDFFFLVLYKGIGYRKKVVFENFRKSFPTKSETEIEEMVESFYRYFCDLILETIKKISMSEAESNERCIYHLSPEVKKLIEEKRSLILLMGHYGNWEWAGSAFTLTAGTPLHVVYKVLSNPYFEKWMVQSRTMFGTRLIKMENTFRDMVANRSEPAAYAFIADQTPMVPAPLWLPFLNQDTPVFNGAEKLAKKMNYPVVFINIKRMKRGYYEIFTEVLFENPKETADNEITETFFKKLEKEIIIAPETWLWSHRRWKHHR